MPTRSALFEKLNLSSQIQALAAEPEGLVLVAGTRSSGKRTMMAAYVDLINRTRRGLVITIEREINIVHQRGNSFISQREVRGNDHDWLHAAHAALREDPDVLVIEDLRTAALMDVALEGAASGHLVIGGLSAHTTTQTIDRIIDLYSSEHRRQIQLALAKNLRGVIVQVLLKRVGGGRVAARELLLNTPAIASLLTEGKTSQLSTALEGGKRDGMVAMNDSLFRLLETGTIERHEAYRCSSDRPAFLALLERQGVDTAFAERLA
jgi:twitching motility protein PilT